MNTEEIHNPENIPESKLPPNMRFLYKSEVGDSAIKDKCTLWMKDEDAFGAGLCAQGNNPKWTYATLENIFKVELKSHKWRDYGDTILTVYEIWLNNTFLASSTGDGMFALQQYLDYNSKLVLIEGEDT